MGKVIYINVNEGFSLNEPEPRLSERKRKGRRNEVRFTYRDSSDLGLRDADSVQYGNPTQRRFLTPF